MKKLAAITSSSAYLYLVSSVYAANIKINEPVVSPGGSHIGYTSISDFLNKAITLAFIIALVAALVMMVWGAVEWIFSGGNKDAVANARNRIVHALIGLVILAVAFAVINLAGGFLGLNLLQNFVIPSPDPSATP